MDISLNFLFLPFSSFMDQHRAGAFLSKPVGKHWRALGWNFTDEDAQAVDEYSHTELSVKFGQKKKKRIFTERTNKYTFNTKDYKWYILLHRVCRGTLNNESLQKMLNHFGTNLKWNILSIWRCFPVVLYI